MPVNPTILHVALPTPLNRLFDYLLPTGAQDLPQVGCRVLVPFGHQQKVGIVMAISEHSSFPLDKLKPALTLLDREPMFCAGALSLCQFAAQYYHYPLGEVLTGALPQKLREADGARPTSAQWQLTQEGLGLNPQSFKRSPKQLAAWQALLASGPALEAQLLATGIERSALKKLEDKALAASRLVTVTNANAATDQLLKETPKTLNTEQQAAFDALRFHRFHCYLLDGVTGSGKTEVYLQAISRVLQAGQQALVLVPEIGLTPQTVERFKARFNVPVTELHSNVAKGARLENWHQASIGEARIVIGTRLAVFASLPKLGIIIVDEEHDLSFKQQDGLRYNARDLAIVRAKNANIPLLLGSATPSLESLNHALSDRYTHLRLQARAGNAKPPAFHLVDMRAQVTNAGLSTQALEAIGQTLARGEQALVFLNRRGFAPSLICQSCGWSAACHACDARMTLHNSPYKLHCHHCGSENYPPKHCPSCFAPQLTALGQGTERAEEVLQQAFSAYPVLRVDQDSMQRKSAMAELNATVNSGAPCLLVGTQMLAKGHHFPKVTLVVIMDADQGLLSGDFRGIERMGQLVTQVAGRAGRADAAGIVLIQSFRPDHPMLQCLIHQGYGLFAHALLQERQQANMPPFSAMALVRAECKRPENAKALLTKAAQIARNLCPPSPEASYIGPIPAFLERRNERFRYQLQMVFSHRQTRSHVLNELATALDALPIAKRVRWSIDVDPQDMS